MNKNTKRAPFQVMKSRSHFRKSGIFPPIYSDRDEEAGIQKNLSHGKLFETKVNFCDIFLTLFHTSINCEQTQMNEVAMDFDFFESLSWSSHTSLQSTW
jgi:hypothetical protein